MFAVDTNVLLYAADSSYTLEHARCRELVDSWRRSDLPWYLTWNVVYEFLRVVTHPRVLTRPWSSSAAWGFIGALTASPSLTVLRHTSRHEAVAREVFEGAAGLRGNLVHDAHTAVLLREHGVGAIYTRDTDFHRFSFLEVRDPLVGDQR